MKINIAFDKETRIWSARCRNFADLNCNASSQIELGRKLEILIPAVTGRTPKPICTPTANDLRLLKTALSTPQPTASFQYTLDLARERFGSRLIHEHQNVFREAHVAVQMATQLGAAQVILCDPDPPDFELQFFDGASLQFEHVEADHPDRHRHAEYKSFWDVLEKFDIDCTLTDIHGWGSVEELAADVARCAEKKLTRNYCRSTSLVIYLNRSPWDSEDQKLYAAIQGASAKAGRYFQAVWVKVGARYFRFWHDDVAAPLPEFPSPDQSEDKRMFDGLVLPKPSQAFLRSFENSDDE